MERAPTMAGSLPRAGSIGFSQTSWTVFPTAARLFAEMIKQDTFDEFLTLPAYEHLS
jgi:hypothetical protein